MAKVKVDNKQTDRQTDRQTGQKQYAPDHSIRGHKKFGTNVTTERSCYKEHTYQILKP